MTRRTTNGIRRTSGGVGRTTPLVTNNVIDDFEGGSPLASYSLIDGGESDEIVITTTGSEVQAGSKALKLLDDDGSGEDKYANSSPGDGLDNYPGVNDAFEYYVRADSNGQSFAYFLGGSGSLTDKPTTWSNYIRVGVEPSESSIVLDAKVGGNRAEIIRKTLSLSENTYYRVAPYATDDGDVTLRVYDDSNTKVAEMLIDRGYNGASDRWISWGEVGSGSHEGIYDEAKLRGSDSKPADTQFSLNRWYKIDAGSGNTLTDSVGNNDGTINGATWTTDSKTGGQALDFDGTDDYVDTPGFGSLFSGNQSFAIAFWVKLDQHFTGQTVYHFNKNHKTRFFNGGGTPSDTYAFQIFDNTNDDKVQVEIPLDSWTHIVCNVTGKVNLGSMEVYKNATVQDTKSSYTTGSSSGANYIGAFDPTSVNMDGVLDDFRVFGRNLSPREVTLLYNNTV